MPPKSKRVLPGKRYPLNMRTTKELRDKIEGAAMASGRSLVQEVEFRLESSFRRQETDELIMEAIDRTLKALGISNDPRTWSPEMHAWAAQQPGLLGLSGHFPEAQSTEKASEQSAENPTESASTDRGEDSK